jgi:hypothetical protein
VLIYNSRSIESLKLYTFFMKTALALFFCLIPFFGNSQGNTFQFSLDNSIPVSKNNISLPQAWAGGLNAVEVSTMDINLDGSSDLILFDRTAQKVVTFISENDTWIYKPEYEDLFPEGLYNWMLLRDYNCDGRKDIFTGHPFGIAVYQNVSTDTDVVWEPVIFYTATSSSEVVLTKGLSGMINLQIQFDDLPSISDVDGDGDLDIFSMSYPSGDVIQFHKNFGMERYSTCDSMVFELADRWWGGVRECECNEFAFDKSDCPPGRVRHAGGKSLLAMDGDGDGFLDLLLSEGECQVLARLDNNAPVESPMINGAATFPPDQPDDFQLYPTAYFEEVNFDVTKDLIISPNFFSKGEEDVDLSNSVWLYNNTGTEQAPVFTAVTRSFLQREMIDEGDNVVPAFEDMDGDGDLDLFLSNNSVPSTITIYENTGTASAPVLTFYTDDYLLFSSLEFTNLKIQFVDLTGDGARDLAFVATDEEINSTNVFYIPNKSKDALEFELDERQLISFQMARGENISFVEVNNDGVPDILKGKSNGAIEFWRNNNKSAPAFILQDADYLGQEPNIQSTRVSAAVSDLNQDGRRDLVLGDESGRLRIISDFANASDLSNAQTHFIRGPLSDELTALNLGGRVWPTTADLYGDGTAEIVVGTTLGGLRILKPETTSDKVVIEIYPNPVFSESEKLKIRVSEDASLSIVSAKGQIVRSQLPLNARTLTEFSTIPFSAGLYILKFQVGSKSYTRRVVIY